MKRTFVLFISIFILHSNIVFADLFGTGDNQFTIDFVDISISTVNYDYRISKFETTNDQWNKFKTELGVMVTGSELSAYDSDPYFTGTYVPTNNVSWYEAAQFVNWLNTSTGHQAAYKFTGTQSTSDYTFAVWDVTDAGYDASNPYRNSNAFYFLPTEDEWVKAAYGNGQVYATKNGLRPQMGMDSNYNGALGQPWDVGSGSQELNGTYDMMGNVWEWMESPYTGNYSTGSIRVMRGSSYAFDHLAGYTIQVTARWDRDPVIEESDIGFRVASIPEPCTVLLLGLGGVLIQKR